MANANTNMTLFCFIQINCCFLSFRKKIRIIPVSYGNQRKILYGMKPDAVYIEKNGVREHISLIIAIDNEGGDFGGYNALIPLSALEGIYGNR